jgi:DNA-binding response OmpR family regulator
VARVLLVEDELQLQRIITMNLARRGCSVAEADTIENAYDLAQAAWEAGYPFDIILLEIHLATRSGWDLLRMLRSPDATCTGMPPAPVVVMSALPVARSRAVEFAPVATLLKPFPISALLQLIERYTEPTSATPARGA